MYLWDLISVFSLFFFAVAVLGLRALSGFEEVPSTRLCAVGCVSVWAAVQRRDAIGR